MEDRHLMPRERRIWSEHGLAIEERQVVSAESGGQDEIIEKDASTTSIILYQCTDEDGTCRIIEVKVYIVICLNYFSKIILLGTFVRRKPTKRLEYIILSKI